MDGWIGGGWGRGGWDGMGMGTGVSKGHKVCAGKGMWRYMYVCFI